LAMGGRAIRGCTGDGGPVPKAGAAGDSSACEESVPLAAPPAAQALRGRYTKRQSMLRCGERPGARSDIGRQVAGTSRTAGAEQPQQHRKRARLR
jgi:hypothetical protein